MKTIGLCMIVKNEAGVILRCLDSVLPLIDYVLVEDTGSTDGTQQVIRGWLERYRIPGEVFDAPWRDFAHNRNLAVARLRERTEIDYAFMMDADDVLTIDPGFDPARFKAGMTGDCYDLVLRTGPLEYRRGCICSNRLDFRYRGVLHEYLERPAGSGPSSPVDGLTVLSTRQGARGQDPEKYRKDIAVFEAALLEETDPGLRARYTFYLAQSYKDADDLEPALTNYLRRAALGGWAEEVFVSLYRAGSLMDELGYPDHVIVGAHLKAYEARPSRAESLFAAARYCRRTRRHHQGYMIGKQALTIPKPPDGLFVVPWIYEYGTLDDFAVTAYWTGHYGESLKACDRLLEEAKIPAGMRPRIEKNRAFALAKLDGGPRAPDPAAADPEPAPAPDPGDSFPRIIVGFT